MITWDQLVMEDGGSGHRVAYGFATFVQGMAQAGNAHARQLMEDFANCQHAAADGRMLTDMPAWLKANGGLKSESGVAK